MVRAADNTGTLKRRVGFWLLTLYGVGVMIGAGIYVLIGDVAGRTGTLAPLAFVIAALIAAPTAIAYAALSAARPESAGEAAYVHAATGSTKLATLIAVAVAGVGTVSAAVVLQGGAGYLTGLVPIPTEAAILVLGVGLTLMAIIGVLESLAFAAVLTVIELGGLVLVIWAGLSGTPVEVAPIAPEPGLGAGMLAGLAGASLLAFFAFIGFEDMVNMAEETLRPERTMPRAIVTALVVTTIVYLLVAWAAVRTVPPAALAESDRPLALVYQTATGQGAGFLSAIAVAAAMNGILAQIVMAARVLYGTGRYTRAFRVFHRASPRFGTPVLATVLAGAIALVLALTAPLVTLAEITTTVLLAIFVAINMALIVLDRRAETPSTVPRWVPWIGAILSLMALVYGVIA